MAPTLSERLLRALKLSGTFYGKRILDRERDERSWHAWRTGLLAAGTANAVGWRPPPGEVVERRVLDGQVQYRPASDETYAAYLDLTGW